MSPKFVGSDRVRKEVWLKCKKAALLWMSLMLSKQVRRSRRGSSYGIRTVPSDIRAAGGVARMANPKIVQKKR